MIREACAALSMLKTGLPVERRGPRKTPAEVSCRGALGKTLYFFQVKRFAVAGYRFAHLIAEAGDIRSLTVAALNRQAELQGVNRDASLRHRGDRLFGSRFRRGGRQTELLFQVRYQGREVLLFESCRGHPLCEGVILQHVSNTPRREDHR